MSYISKELVGKLAEYLDDKIKAKGIVEAFDGIAIKAILGFASDQYAEKVPEQYRDELVEFLDALVKGDKAGMSDAAIDALKEIVGDMLIASATDPGQGPTEPDPEG